MYDIGSFIQWFSTNRKEEAQHKLILEGQIFNLVKAFHRTTSLSSNFRWMKNCHRSCDDKVDFVNPEGHQILRNIYESLPLGGPPGQILMMVIVALFEYRIGLRRNMKVFGASDEELEELMKDQPLSADASPTALSPGYIADSNPEEDKEDPEEDPADHPADG
ncbi:hypothetical protein Tco_1539061 [Tanacetum coccineum]